MQSTGIEPVDAARVAARGWYRSWRIGGLVAAFLFVITVVIVAIFVWAFPPGMRFIQG